MNTVLASILGGLLGAPLLGAPAASPDEFFIVSSVDAAKSTMVLKRPTEVTLVMGYTAKTRCLSEQGKPLRTTDLRAGDTVFITSERDGAGSTVATSIRRGPMTLPELRRRYLHLALELK